LSVVIVVCCRVEVSATNWSLVQTSPTDCGASFVWSTAKENQINRLNRWATPAVTLNVAN
jgi:hypothetical protein